MQLPLELCVACSGGNTVSTSFRFERGRYRHSIVLRSCDGLTLDHWEDESDSDDDDWPASPPIQQLSLESINDRPTLLGVGQAGKSHWSISVETILSDVTSGLKFDLACRCRLQPPWLGSRYQRDDRLFGLGPKLLMVPDTMPANSTNGLLMACCQFDQLESIKYPATFRWSYLVIAQF